MTAVQIVEVIFALGALVAAVIMYRRGNSQSAVLLIILAALLLIHGLGLLDYRPSPGELGQ